jgi:hypothetical protein
MALPADKSPDKQHKHSRRPAPRDVDEGADDGNDEGDDTSIRIEPANFLTEASGMLAKGQPALIAGLLAERMEARRKKNFWKRKFEALVREVPADAVVLVGEEARAIESLLDRKLELGKLHTLIETLENDKATLANENLQFKARDLYHEFAKTSGYNADAIEGVITGERLHSELKDHTVKTVGPDGRETGTKTQKTLMVRKAADPKAPLVPFDEYVDSHVKWVRPSLTTPSNGTSGPTSTAGPLFTEQAPSSGSGPTDPVATFRKRRNEERSREGAAVPVSPLQHGALPPMRRGVPGAQ